MKGLKKSPSFPTVRVRIAVTKKKKKKEKKKIWLAGMIPIPSQSHPSLFIADYLLTIDGSYSASLHLPGPVALPRLPLDHIHAVQTLITQHVNWQVQCHVPRHELVN
jgi:hypothetical protein